VLGNKDGSDAATFRVNARRFDSALGQLEAVERSIRAADHGAGVAITEPVPLYVLQASGLVNRTPAQFSEAVEEGNDVPPAVLRQMLKLFADHRVRALVYNEQTSGAETRQVLAEAHRDHVPAVPVTETLPAGTDYLSWMRHNVTAVRHALSRGDSS
jgi:zinc/manganese transport system substrate-binding protein